MDVKEVKRIKQAIRERIWHKMEASRVALFPGAFGRIPNFVGAAEAARHLAELDDWHSAETLKANPDSPQAPAREMAIREGKTIFMAVPRLRQEKCFVRLDGANLRGKEKFAATIRGAFKLGTLVHLSEMPQIDFVLIGSVAVNLKGARVGKGGGYSDIEFAIARQIGLVKDTTPVVTTVHPIQIVDDEIPMLPHDIPVDFIVTPNELIATEQAFSKPKGILWDWLDEDKLESIPILNWLRKY
ncbi:MAG: 5-formyltetrahydrofolate cyclo-ligase [Armatimonadetes bacterium]|nr:5-formyltetrahydrofolate cyclo-ligase [Armatimonadota bacterium]